MSEKIRLSDSINSTYREYLPVISPDAKTLYFCRTGHPENLGYSESEDDQDIWFSELNTDGTWSKAKNIGVPLNNNHDNAVCSVTPDGNTLLLFGNYDPNDNSNTGVSVSFRTADGWSVPQKLIIEDFNNLDNYANFYLSNDRRTLLMSLQCADSYGNQDIYFSHYNEFNSVWSAPANVGSTINTPSIESSPFLASDGISLYFSSDGHKGYGDFDVFLSRRLDDSWKNWSIPENLGDKVNTPGFDAYYYMSALADYVYFVSELDEYGDIDIFRMKMPEKFKPAPVILISGIVLNPITNKPIEAKILYSRVSDGKIIGEARTNPLTGEYKIILPVGEKYSFRAVAKKFLSVSDYIDATNITEYKEIVRNLEFVPLEFFQESKLNKINVFFAYNESKLKRGFKPELQKIVKLLKDFPELKIEISGHTDNVGNENSNIILSRLRANTVASFLIRQGLPYRRVKWRGYGMARPVATNETEEGRAKNRRVEFSIYK